MIDAPDFRCLTLTCTRLSTPTRSTSTASTKAWIPEARSQRRDAGIGDHDVEPAEFGNTFVDRRGECGTIADVSDLRERAPALLLDQSSGLVEVLGPRQRVLVGLDVFTQCPRR